MTRLRRLLIVTLVIGAIPGVDLAQADVFKVESIPSRLTGIQEKHNFGGGESPDLYKTIAGTIACNTTAYSGAQVEEGSEVLELAPTANECPAGPTLGPMTFDPNECKYIFRLSGATTTGTTDISCPAGKEIVWTYGSPTLKGSFRFPPQTGKGGVTYANIGSGSTRELTLTIKITNLKYSIGGGTGLGGLNPQGPFESGTYEGALKVTAENWAGTVHVGVFLA